MRDHAGELDFGVFDHMDFGDRDLHELYEMRLRCVEAYDRWGFYSYHLAEHHFTPLGGAPSPSLFLAAVSQRTQRLRFGPLVYLFPFYHPLRLAEEICMLDQLGNGRLDVGLGRGISPVESRLFGNEPDEAQSLLDETREIVLAALANGTVTHRGRAYTFEDVPMLLAPVQRPHPPLWYGTTTPDGAERAARAGYQLITNATGPAVRDVAAAYVAERGRAGAAAFKLGLSRFIVVAETDEEAIEIGRAAYPSWQRSFHHLYRVHGRSPVKGERPEEFGPTLEMGRSVAGSPETVARLLDEQIRDTGINYVVGQFAFGTMPLEAALRSIELFGSRVMPALRERAGTPA